MMPSRNGPRADRGTTLIELLVTVGLVGLVAAVLAAAVTVIFRSQDGVVASTAESHDTRQIVSYLPLDVASGPSRADAYRASNLAVLGPRGSGCDPAGDENVLRIDVNDRSNLNLDLVEKRIAYRWVGTGGKGRIDRYVCEKSGATWTATDAVSVVNIADYLDETSIAVAEVIIANPIETDPALQEVARVELRYVQRGDTETIIAAPREEQPLSNSGICDSEPLSAARDFSSFVEGDVFLKGNGSGVQVKSSLFVGGQLRFNDGSSVAQAVPDEPEIPVGDEVGLVAGSIDWLNSTGSLEVKPGHDLLIENGVFVENSGTVSQAIGSGPPEIHVSNTGDTLTPGADPVITPGTAFTELRACADRLAGLPDSCNNGTCAQFVAPPAGFTGTDTFGGPQLRLGTTGETDTVNVFNIHEDNLDDMDGFSIQIGFDGPFPDVDNPLVINVASDDTVDFTPLALQGAGNNSEMVIWNFPNATLVTINAGNNMWGTVMAPYAHVISHADIDGTVIANKFTMNGASISDERSFQGTLAW